jgi:hypothetical protein
VRKLGTARHLPRAALGFEGSSEQGGLDERLVGLLEKAQGMVYDDITTSIDALTSAVRSMQPDPRAYAAPESSVVLPSDRPPLHVSAKPRPSAESNIFRREGEYWTIAYDGTDFRLKDAKGLHYIAHLLSHPGLEVHVADLVAAMGKRQVDPAAKSYCRMSKTQLAELHLQVSRLGTAGPMLDSQAKAAYQRRLHELQEVLEEAQRFNDPARAAKAQAEIAFIANELGAAYGLGGRVRQAADTVEKIRKAATNRIRESLTKIQQAHPAAWRHLFSAIKTGAFCSYTPDKHTPWHC